MDLMWNGQKVDGVEVVRLPANISLEMAADHLTQFADGRDTLGIQGPDADYLVLGHGLRAPDQGERLSINGQAVLPAFLENEADTAPEGFVDPRDLKVERKMIATGVTAIAGGIAGNIIGRRVGGKMGAAVGSAIGLPIAGVIHNHVFRPLSRKITGKPTLTMSTIDATVVSNLMKQAYSLPPTANRRQTVAPGLQPLNRGGIRQPQTYRPQPVQPTMAQPTNQGGLLQPDIGAGDDTWRGD
jgi:hypothetical protein